MSDAETRQTVLLLVKVGVIFAVSLVGYMVFQSFSSQKEQSDWVKSGAPNGGIVVVSDRLIPEGAIVSADDLLEVKRKPMNIPADVVICKDVILGKKTNVEIPYNEYVSLDNFTAEAKVPEVQESLLKKRKSKEDPICSHPLMPDIWKVTDKMVTVKEDVPAEERFDNSNLEYLYESGKRVDDSIFDKWQAVNRLSKFGVGNGQPITTQDFFAGDKEVFVYKAKEDLDVGHKMVMDDLEEVRIASRKCPGTAVLDGQLIVGRVVNQPIKKGSMIKASYLK